MNPAHTLHTCLFMICAWLLEVVSYHHVFLCVVYAIPETFDMYIVFGTYQTLWNVISFIIFNVVLTVHRR